MRYLLLGGVFISDSRSRPITGISGSLEYGDSISLMGVALVYGLGRLPSTGEFVSVEFGGPLAFIEQRVAIGLSHRP